MKQNNQSNLSRISRGQKEKDQRFQQLRALACDGNEEAISDLWREYHYDFTVEG